MLAPEEDGHSIGPHDIQHRRDPEHAIVDTPRASTAQREVVQLASCSLAVARHDHARQDRHLETNLGINKANDGGVRVPIGDEVRVLRAVLACSTLELSKEPAEPVGGAMRHKRGSAS